MEREKKERVGERAKEDRRERDKKERRKRRGKEVRRDLEREGGGGAVMRGIEGSLYCASA